MGALLARGLVQVLPHVYDIEISKSISDIKMILYQSFPNSVYIKIVLNVTTWSQVRASGTSKLRFFS